MHFGTQTLILGWTECAAWVPKCLHVLFSSKIRKIGIGFGNRPIADFFHDQIIFIKDCELYTIGHSLLLTETVYCSRLYSTYPIRQQTPNPPAQFPSFVPAKSLHSVEVIQVPLVTLSLTTWHCSLGNATTVKTDNCSKIDVNNVCSNINVWDVRTVIQGRDRNK